MELSPTVQDATIALAVEQTFSKPSVKLFIFLLPLGSQPPGHPAYPSGLPLDSEGRGRLPDPQLCIRGPGNPVRDSHHHLCHQVSQHLILLPPPPAYSFSISSFSFYFVLFLVFLLIFRPLPLFSYSSSYPSSYIT